MVGWVKGLELLMHLPVATFAAIALTALTLGGCGKNKPSGSGAAGSAKTTTGAATTTTTAPPTTTTTAPPTTTTTTAPAKEGSATIKGVVSFSGSAPEMKVPAKRKAADICNAKEIKHNAVLVKNGKLQDVLVRISAGGVPGNWKAPTTASVIDRVDCTYTPRIQGAMVGQALELKNSDPMIHTAHAYKGTVTLFNQVQPKGSPPITKHAPGEASVVKLSCDVHPWMRGFVVVTDHPFFAVSGEDGSFEIEKVPAGTYTVEALHTQYGMVKKEGIVVKDGGEITVDFELNDSMAEPDWNKGELEGLF